MKSTTRRSLSVRAAPYLLWLLTTAALLAGLLLPLAGTAGEGDAGTPQAVTLDEAIRIAMQQNPDILIALEEIRRQKAIVIETRAPALPQVSATGVFTKIDPRLLDIEDTTVTTGTQTFLPITESYILTGTVRQVLYSAAVAPRLRAAKIEAGNAFLQLRETVNRVENQVRRDFYQALLADSLVEVQKEASRLLLDQSRERLKRFDAGDITRFGVLQAKVALSNQGPALESARSSARLARVRLAQTLGIPHGPREQRLRPLQPIGSLDVRPEKISASRAFAFAEANRPLLKLRQQETLIGDERIAAAKAGYHPIVSANANYQLHNTTRGLDDTINGYFAGLSVDWPIFDGGATRARVEQARAMREQAELRARATLGAVEAEVADAYERLEEARRLLDSRAGGQAESREAFDLARAQLEAGEGTQIDVLTAQLALTQSRVTELQARFNYNLALADLDRAIGSSKSYQLYFDDPLLRNQAVLSKPRTGK